MTSISPRGSSAIPNPDPAPGLSPDLKASRLRPGLATSAVATVLFAICATVVALSAEDLHWLANRAAIAALIVALFGLVIGIDGLIGLATLPMLGGALAGVDPASGPALGRSLIIGCLWYIGLELAWWSVELRNNTVRSPAIAQQRAREVATVVIVTLAVGLAATGFTYLAPTRTLLVRALMAGAILITLAGAARHLTTSGPAVDPSTAEPEPPRTRARIRPRDRRAG